MIHVFLLSDINGIDFLELFLASFDNVSSALIRLNTIKQLVQQYQYLLSKTENIVVTVRV